MKSDSFLARHIARIIDLAIKSYGRRCESLERADLRQTAWVACLEAVQTYTLGSGTLSPYLWRAAVLSIRRAMWATSTITSGHWHRPEISVPKVSQTSAGVDMHEGDAGDLTMKVVLIDDRPMPEELIIAADLEARAVAAMLAAGASIETSRAFCAGLIEAREVPRAAVLGARAAVRDALRA